jgi:hypothetical protein
VPTTGAFLTRVFNSTAIAKLSTKSGSSVTAGSTVELPPPSATCKCVVPWLPDPPDSGGYFGSIGHTVTSAVAGLATSAATGSEGRRQIETRRGVSIYLAVLVGTAAVYFL